MSHPSKRSPKLQTSTLWHHPTQQHAEQEMGDPRYPGRTPSFVIWNLLERYTRPGDLVCDPFCGGGTTLDVARSLGREARGFDVRPHRDDIEAADARRLPLDDVVVDFFFMDPPYSTHLEYSKRDDCIGELSAFSPAYFGALERVFGEVHRCLKDRRYLAVFVGDTFQKRQGFVGIGAELYRLLAQRFRPIDHVAVVRGNRDLEKPRYHRAAAEGNFYLRGFNHLLIFKKEDAENG